MAQSYEEATQVVLELSVAREATRWAVGEVALEQAEAGMKPAQMATDWGYAASTLRRYMATVRAFPPETRNPLLSFSHHLVCAATPDPIGWLTRAEEKAWSIRDLTEAIHTAHAADPQEARQTAFDRALQRLRKVWEATEAADRMERAAAITAWYWDAVRPAVARAQGDSR